MSLLGLFSDENTTSTQSTSSVDTQNLNVQGVSGPALTGMRGNQTVNISSQVVDGGLVDTAKKAIIDALGFGEKALGFGNEALRFSTGVTDASVELARKVSQSAIDSASENNKRSLQSFEAIATAAMSSMRDSQDKGLTYAQAASESAWDFAKNATKSEGMALNEQLIKWGALAVGVLAFAMMVKK